jgi:hypothetical protein
MLVLVGDRPLPSDDLQPDSDLAGLLPETQWLIMWARSVRRQMQANMREFIQGMQFAADAARMKRDHDREVARQNKRRGFPPV